MIEQMTAAEYPVMLRIRGEQAYDGADPDVIELMTEGTLTAEADGSIRLSYNETELTGLAGTRTDFLVRGSKVILSRTGTCNSTMVFEEGVQHTSFYETPVGALSVDVQATKLKHNLTERGGVMEIFYTISVQHNASGRNSFKIRVRRKMERPPMDSVITT